MMQHTRTSAPFLLPLLVVLALASLSLLHQGAAAARVCAEPSLRAQFGLWMAKNNKSYSSDEFVRRFAIWRDNNAFIEDSNARADKLGYTLETNLYADLTQEEHAAIYLSTFPPQPSPLYARDALSSDTFRNVSKRHPASLDWRTWKGVQRVKNQGTCGGDYAFSAIGALETAFWRSYNILPDLSEQHVIDCTGEYGNGGCTGGWMHTALQWLQDKNGAIAQRDYPYTAIVGSCQHASKPKAAYVLRYSRIPAGNEKTLLDAVATTGTVSIAYNAGSQQHSYYRGGILDVPNCGNTPTHAALVVGYGTENGMDYWIIKNSWGTSWGEQGYFRLARGKNMCGIADWASYPIAF